MEKYYINNWNIKFYFSAGVGIIDDDAIVVW